MSRWGGERSDRAQDRVVAVPVLVDRFPRLAATALPECRQSAPPCSLIQTRNTTDRLIVGFRGMVHRCDAASPKRSSAT